MRIISRRAEVNPIVASALGAYQLQGVAACVANVCENLLLHKVKFPILEHCAHLLSDGLSEKDQLEFCDRIEGLKTEGGNVILGILLQKRLSEHFDQSIEKAVQYISNANAWYVCDIIGERVFGVALLQFPDQTLAVFKQLSRHPSNWVVRSIGAGAHYAIKKKAPRKTVDQIFEVLLENAKAKDKEIRQGIGWAAKTTAKFHPEIIGMHLNTISDPAKTDAWFRRKIEIGLNRNAYAKGD